MIRASVKNLSSRPGPLSIVGSLSVLVADYFDLGLRRPHRTASIGPLDCPRGEGEPPCDRAAAVVPPVSGAVLYHDVPRLQRDFGAVVEFKPDRALEDEVVVERRRAMHPCIVGVRPRWECVSHELMELGALARRERYHGHRTPAGRRESRRHRRLGAVIRKLAGVIAAPQQRGRRASVTDRDRRHLVVTDDDRRAVWSVTRHYPPYCHSRTLSLILMLAIVDMSVSLACCHSDCRKAVTIATWLPSRHSYGDTDQQLRGLILGLGVGGFLAALAWLDSGILLGGLIVFVVLSVFYGVWMVRRMSRHWPGAKQLSGSERKRVAGAARGGHPIYDPRLAQSVVDYRNGLHAAAEDARPFRWLLPIVLVVGVVTAAWDAVFGTWGNAIASAIYLVMLLVELFWWPKRQRQLLDNADRAAEMARDSAE